MKIHALVLDDDVNAHKAVCSALASFEDVGVVNIGLNETEYTAQLFAGDTSVELVTKLIAVILIFFYSFTADETVYNAFDAAYEQLVAALGVTPNF